MLVVTEVVFIASEKVTEIFTVVGTPLTFGETEETVGAVVSSPVSSPVSGGSDTVGDTRVITKLGGSILFPLMMIPGP